MELSFTPKYKECERVELIENNGLATCPSRMMGIGICTHSDTPLRILTHNTIELVERTGVGTTDYLIATIPPPPIPDERWVIYIDGDGMNMGPGCDNIFYHCVIDNYGTVYEFQSKTIREIRHQDIHNPITKENISDDGFKWGYSWKIYKDRDIPLPDYLIDGVVKIPHGSYCRESFKQRLPAPYTKHYYNPALVRWQPRTRDESIQIGSDLGRFPLCERPTTIYSFMETIYTNVDIFNSQQAYYLSAIKDIEAKKKDAELLFVEDFKLSNSVIEDLEEELDTTYHRIEILTEENTRLKNLYDSIVSSVKTFLDTIGNFINSNIEYLEILPLVDSLEKCVKENSAQSHQDEITEILQSIEN